MKNPSRRAKMAVNMTVKPILAVVVSSKFRTKMVRTGRIEETTTAIIRLVLSNFESEYDRSPASSSMTFPARNRSPNRRWKREAIWYVMKLVKESPSESGALSEM